jgi:hypothetical protein
MRASPLPRKMPSTARRTLSRRLSRVLGLTPVLILVLVVSPAATGSGPGLFLTPPFGGATSLVGWSVHHQCGSYAKVTTHPAASPATGGVRMAMGVSASGSCASSTRPNVSSATGEAGFLIPFNASTGNHTVSVNWSLSWNTNVSGGICSHGPFRFTYIEGVARAWVFLYVVDLTNGSSLSSALSPYRFLSLSSHGSTINSNGSTSITLNGTFGLVGSHNYEIKTFVRASLHASGATCVLGTRTFKVGSSAMIDMARPFGDSLPIVTIR